MMQTTEARSIDATVAQLNSRIIQKGWKFEPLQPPAQPVKRGGILGVVDSVYSLVKRVRGTPAPHHYYKPNSFLCTPLNGKREDFYGAPYVMVGLSESSLGAITVLHNGSVRLFRGIGFPDVVSAETLDAALYTGFNAPPKRANHDQDM